MCKLQRNVKIYLIKIEIYFFIIQNLDRHFVRFIAPHEQPKRRIYTICFYWHRLSVCSINGL